MAPRRANRSPVWFPAGAPEPLAAALKDSEFSVREAAAEALGQLKDTRAVEPLIAALKDDDWGVAAAAAEALGKLSDPRAVQALIAALEYAPRSEPLFSERNVRVAAAAALA